MEHFFVMNQFDFSALRLHGLKLLKNRIQRQIFPFFVTKFKMSHNFQLVVLLCVAEGNSQQFTDASSGRAKRRWPPKS